VIAFVEDGPATSIASKGKQEKEGRFAWCRTGRSKYAVHAKRPFPAIEVASAST